MASFVVNTGSLSFILAGAAALISTGCSGTKESEATAPTMAATSNNTSSAAVTVASASNPAVAGVEPSTGTSNQFATGAEAPGGEVPAERVKGRWRVVDAIGAENATATIGSTLSFTDEALGWVGKDGKVTPDCRDPFYHVVTEMAEVRIFAPAFKPAWTKFELPRGEVGAIHAWECGDGESIFGPRQPAGGSIFVPVGTDRLIMNWHGGAVLLLRR